MEASWETRTCSWTLWIILTCHWGCSRCRQDGHLGCGATPHLQHQGVLEEQKAPQLCGIHPARSRSRQPGMLPASSWSWGVLGQPQGGVWGSLALTLHWQSDSFPSSRFLKGWFCPRSHVINIFNSLCPLGRPVPCTVSCAQLPDSSTKPGIGSAVVALFLPERGETCLINAVLNKNMQFWTGLDYSFVLGSGPKEWIFKNIKMSHFDIF